MIKILGRIKEFFNQEQLNKQRYDYVLSLFDKPSVWKEYQSSYGGFVKGLTENDVCILLKKEIKNSTLEQASQILRDLSIRQIISGRFSTTKEGYPVYRPLLWG